MQQPIKMHPAAAINLIHVKQSQKAASFKTFCITSS